MWLICGLLAEDECAELRARAEQLGLVECSGPVRECEEVELHEPALAALLWERARTHVPAEVRVDSSCPEELGLPVHDEELHGVWHATGVNPRIRIVRYPGHGRGHCGPRRDGAFELSSSERSLLTLLAYLSALPPGVGGRTRLLRSDLPLYRDAHGRFGVESAAESVTLAFRPEAAGCGLCMYHERLRDAEALARDAPPVWVLQTEVMYARTSPTRALSSAALEEARALEVEAESIECEQPMVAVQLYMRADRLRKGRALPRHAPSRAREEQGHAALAVAADGGRAGGEDDARPARPDPDKSGLDGSPRSAEAAAGAVAETACAAPSDDSLSWADGSSDDGSVI